ncbi:SGNH/GDSL hydrolase family protein [Streptomyces caniscabiei]|uniref:SGNH/GDSL hydrolase family protein n=1 Tax=Streptomyces caniscabiei TaxID=2746961 RepID=A0ABU4MT02_9ACTN|nr:SGNH/GDSL hydrolase family protein [Streptomyces caniscabiei]MBE4737916.1 SGNH/GDSL hydrolase family protein [Streptomyces caniscabiei]MBE4757285.1 SGNH/GDSL hydrolase family protein [Streptomyces caniscabiei]MBE4769284.1 SGNH/GDSL hydrolase family protein [Streptomyces caniscabiei]MBE4784995.1 SGNH/GDSL hydrolase family protein [Streptomyces caniscabiei]MBE4795779.1 SGNH/GDSL hydrolase family protein [Streptomyces caniscabiei]
MRKRRHRSRAVWGAATAAFLLAVTGCDATGGDSPGPEGTGPRAAASPRPTPAWDSTPESLVAVGDSITRGFDACKVLSDCPEVSWATGTDASVDSLAVRLLGRSGALRHSWNYAVTGARMADLPNQMARAVTREPELVTVMVGANDACRATVDAMTPVADFRADFEDSMATLRDALPKAQVFVASVPDLKRLWSAGRASPVGKQVWKLGICPSMLADPDVLTTAAGRRRDAVQDRVEAYNDVLREVCAKDRHCRYDGDAVFDYRFGQAQLSQWDWFHPSVDGQARLAEIAYRIVSAKGS